jgi:hypothetical protein
MRDTGGGADRGTFFPQRGGVTLVRPAAQRDGPRGFGGDDAVVPVAVVRGDDVIDETGLDGITLIEDRRNQLFLALVVDRS